MLKLKKADFDKEHRFRECRKPGLRSSKDGLVACVTCSSMTGGVSDEEPAFCENEGRFRRIKIAQYWEGFGKGTSQNLASKRVCSAYESRPLPEGVKVPVLLKGHLILLGTQWRDIYHADPNCPYVLEELRMQQQGTKWAEVTMEDRSNLVPQETLGRQICEMSCCDSKLPYHTWRVDDYRRAVGIKPDGTEEKPFVRKIVDHGRKVVMQPEQIKNLFNLQRFNSTDIGDIHRRISAVSDHLNKNCNRLGSKLLSEAVNPVHLDYSFHVLKDSLVGETNGDVWVYDERLFNSKEGLEKPLSELDTIPEGIILCRDSKRIFSKALFECNDGHLGRFSFYGTINDLSDESLISKGLTHFLEISAVTYHGHEHMWGEFGEGFSALASFYEE